MNLLAIDMMSEKNISLIDFPKKKNNLYKTYKALMNKLMKNIMRYVMLF